MTGAVLAVIILAPLVALAFPLRRRAEAEAFIAHLEAMRAATATVTMSIDTRAAEAAIREVGARMAELAAWRVLARESVTVFDPNKTTT